MNSLKKILIEESELTNYYFMRIDWNIEICICLKTAICF